MPVYSFTAHDGKTYDLTSDAELSHNDLAKQFGEAGIDIGLQPELPPAEGPVATIARSFLSGIIPAVGTALGAAGGGLLGIESGPGAIAAGAAGAALGGGTATKFQHWLMGDKWFKENEEQLAANALKNPLSAGAGEIIPTLISMRGGNVPSKALGMEEGALERISQSGLAGLRLGASQTAQQLEAGKDVDLGDFADNMARGAFQFGPLGILPHAKTLATSLGYSIPQAGLATLSGAVYDAMFHDKPLDFAEITKKAGADVIPFALFNAVAHGLQGAQNKIAKGREIAVGEPTPGEEPPEGGMLTPIPEPPEGGGPPPEELAPPDLSQPPAATPDALLATARTHPDALTPAEEGRMFELLKRRDAGLEVPPDMQRELDSLTARNNRAVTAAVNATGDPMAAAAEEAARQAAAADAPAVAAVMGDIAGQKRVETFTKPETTTPDENIIQPPEDILPQAPEGTRGPRPAGEGTPEGGAGTEAPAARPETQVTQPPTPETHAPETRQEEPAGELPRTEARPAVPEDTSETRSPGGARPDDSRGPQEGEVTQKVIHYPPLGELPSVSDRDRTDNRKRNYDALFKGLSDFGVHPAVIDSLKKREILDSVVSTLPVDVVDGLGFGERTTKELLNNPDVLLDRYSISGNADALTRIVKALGDGITRLRTELLRRLGRGDSEGAAALFTRPVDARFLSNLISDRPISESSTRTPGEFTDALSRATASSGGTKRADVERVSADFARFLDSRHGTDISNSHEFGKNKGGNRPETTPSLTFEDFEKQYRDTFKRWMSYKPEEVGSRHYAEILSKMADEHPDWVEKIEAMPEKAPEQPASKPEGRKEKQPHGKETRKKGQVQKGRPERNGEEVLEAPAPTVATGGEEPPVAEPPKLSGAARRVFNAARRDAWKKGAGGKTSDTSFLKADDIEALKAHGIVFTQDKKNRMIAHYSEEMHRKDVQRALEKPRVARRQPEESRLFRESHPIFTLMESVGKLMSRTTAKARGAEFWDRHKAEWDDAPSLSHPSHNAIYSKGGGMMPSDVARDLHDEHGIGDGTVGKLWEIIGKESAGAMKGAKSARIERTRLADEERKAVEQDRDFKEQTDTPGDGKKPVDAWDLNPGDSVWIDGEEFKVHDAGEGSDVILEDGARFGKQLLETGETIYVEKVDRAPMEGEEGIGLEPEERPDYNPATGKIENPNIPTSEAPPTGDTIGHEPSLKVTGDGDVVEELPPEGKPLIPEAEMPFNLVSETKDERADREARELAAENKRKEAETKAAQAEAEKQQGKLFPEPPPTLDPFTSIKSTGPMLKGITVDKAYADVAVDRLPKEVKALVKAARDRGDLIVTDKANLEKDVPGLTPEELAYVRDNDAEGFYKNGKMVVVADSIGVTKADGSGMRALARVINHELFHDIFRTVVEADPKLKEQWQDFISRIPESDLHDLAARYTDLADWTVNPESKRRIIEEWGAEKWQQYQAGRMTEAEKTLFEKFLDVVKKVWSHVMSGFAKPKATDADLQAYFDSIAKARGRGTGTRSGDLAASLKPKDDAYSRALKGDEGGEKIGEAVDASKLLREADTLSQSGRQTQMTGYRASASVSNLERGRETKTRRAIKWRRDVAALGDGVTKSKDGIYIPTNIVGMSNIHGTIFFKDGKPTLLLNAKTNEIGPWKASYRLPQEYEATAPKPDSGGTGKVGSPVDLQSRLTSAKPEERPDIIAKFYRENPNAKAELQRIVNQRVISRIAAVGKLAEIDNLEKIGRDNIQRQLREHPNAALSEDIRRDGPDNYVPAQMIIHLENHLHDLQREAEWLTINDNEFGKKLAAEHLAELGQRNAYSKEDLEDVAALAYDNPQERYKRAQNLYRKVSELMPMLEKVKAEHDSLVYDGPIELDPSGRIIPLEERFQREGENKNDIRFSLKPRPESREEQDAMIRRGELTPAANELMNIRREQFGWDTFEAPDSREDQVVMDRVLNKFRMNQDYPKSVVDRLQGTGAAPTDEDVAAVIVQARHLENQLTRIEDVLNSASSNEADRASANLRNLILTDELDRTQRVMNTIGTIQARAFKMRQNLLAQDYSMGGMVKKAVAAKGGKDLTPEETGRIEELSKTLRDLQAKNDDLQKRLDAAPSQAMVDSLKKQLDEHIAKGKKYDAAADERNQEPDVKKAGWFERALNFLTGRERDVVDAIGEKMRKIDVLQQRIASIKAAQQAKDIRPSLKEIPEDYGSGMTLEQLEAELGRLHESLKEDVKELDGINRAKTSQPKAKTKIADFTKEDLLDAANRERLRSTLRDLKNEPVPPPEEQFTSIRNVLKQHAKKPMLEGAFRDALKELGVTDEQAAKMFAHSQRSDQEVPHKVLEGMMRKFISEGDEDVHSIAGKISDWLIERGVNWSPEQVMRGIAKYGEVINPSQNYVKKRGRQIRAEMLVLSQIETITNELRNPDLTGYRRDEQHQKLRDLVKVRNDLMRKYGIESRSAASQFKGARDRAIRALENQLADLMKELHGEGVPRPERPKTDLGPRGEALKKEVKEISDYLKDLKGKPDLTAGVWNERRQKAADAIIERMTKAMAEGRFVREEPQKFPETEETKAKFRQIETLREAFQQMRDADPQYKLRQRELKDRALTRAMKRALDYWQGRIDNKQFITPTKEQRELTKEQQDIQLQIEGKKREFDKMKRGWELANRTGLEKTQDWLVKLKRMWVLSSPVSVAKLTAAATSRVGNLAIEDVMGNPLSRLLPTAFQKKGVIEGATSGDAIAKAIAGAVEKIGSDVASLFRTGQTEMDIKHSKKLGYDDDWSGFFGRIHAILKSPVKRLAYQLAMEKQIAAGRLAGEDVADPAVLARYGVRAYEWGNRQIFMQSNAFAEMWNSALSMAERKGHKGVATFGRVLLPIVKVPTNIVSEAFTYILGLPMGAANVAKMLGNGVKEVGGMKAAMKDVRKAWEAGLEKLTPDEADTIQRQFKKGALGLGLVALGYFNPQAAGGYYMHGQKRREDEAQFGAFKIGDWQVPAWMTHTPFFEAIQFGATVRRLAEQKITKHGEEVGLTAAAAGAALGLLEETPFVNEMFHVASVGEGHGGISKFIGELAKSSVVPAALDWTARRMDVRNPDGISFGEHPLEYLNLPTQRREAEGIAANIQSGIPLARESLPIKYTSAFAPDMVVPEKIKDYAATGAPMPSPPQKAALESKNGQIDDERWQRYVELRGRIIRDEMLKSMWELRRANEEEQHRIIGRISNKATTTAKERMRLK